MIKAWFHAEEQGYGCIETQRGDEDEMMTRQKDGERGHDWGLKYRLLV